jgi:cell division protein FtsI/penicillin-binding protein 2
MKHWRSNLILFLIFVFGAAVIGRLFFLQIINHDFYKALARGQQEVFTENRGERGEIFLQDKEGNLYTLATNKTFYFIYASPAKVKEKEETAEKVSKILGLSKESVLEKLRKKGLYELIKDDLTKEELEGLENNMPEGIYLGKKRKRYYPLGTFASHISGFVGGDNIGQYGIEGYWDEVLTGGRGGSSGSNLILTIDYNIQYLAEKLLKTAHENLNIEEGQIIVADPNSGKIVALAHFPSFDPNEYSKENLKIFQNGAIQKIFEPGSVFKPLTMAAALDTGKITPKTTYIDAGEVKIGGYTIYNYDHRVWGEQTMTGVLERSINTGAVYAEEQAGHQTFLEYIRGFGIFKKTGIDLQGEVFSQNREFKKGYEINFATAAFGQGIEMTPVQLVRAFSAIANGGKLPSLHLIEKIQGQPFNEFQASEKKIISEKTSSQLAAMLVSVVENGFGKGAKITGYYIAGKTGTAQISWSALGIEKRGYSDKTIQSFIGFAPAFSPKFLIMVKLNNPQTKTAEYSAVPIFRQLAKYIIDYWQIPPDYEPD